MGRGGHLPHAVMSSTVKKRKEWEVMLTGPLPHSAWGRDLKSVGGFVVL